MKSANRKRKAAAFKRQYHSVERVEFVKSLPCAGCGIRGFSENAHLLGNDGMSRKGKYATIGPLCGGRLLPSPAMSCHEMYDLERDLFYHLLPNFKPEQIAAKTEALWLASTGGAAPRTED